jgi:aminoglycoside phosphotransferase (APT) family kinase protein
LPKEIVLGLKKLQQQIEEIKYTPKVLENGSLVLKARIVDSKVLKKSSHNKIEYEMMQFMQERNFVMVPRYLGTEDDVDIFSYIDGKVSEYPRTIDNNALVDAVKFLKKFHEIAQEKLGMGKTYIHGDLNTKHLVFKDGKLAGIIDWESCSIGNIEDELIDLIFEWTDISSYIRRNERVFETIKNILETYEADDKILADFSDKMKNRINKRIYNLSKDIPNYEYMYETLHHALTFVELYKDRLDSM